MSEEMVQDEPTLLMMTRELFDGWERARQSGFDSRPGVSVHQAATVYAVAAHAHRLGLAALRLYADVLRLEAGPVVRSLYEHALTAMWLAQYPDAALAFITEYDRNRANSFRETIKAGGGSGPRRPQTGCRATAWARRTLTMRPAPRASVRRLNSGWS